MPLYAEIKFFISDNLLVKHLSKNQIINLYFKKTKTINGQQVVIYDNIDSSDIFYKNILNKTPSQVHAYWMKQVFLGKNIPPLKLNHEELLEKLTQEQNVIIYSTKDIDARVIYEEN